MEDFPRPFYAVTRLPQVLVPVLLLSISVMAELD
jgi:hypothetical protein